MLLKIIEKLLKVVKGKGVDDDRFWGDVCKDLYIPNVKINRHRLKLAYTRHKKVGLFSTVTMFGVSQWEALLHDQLQELQSHHV